MTNEISSCYDREVRARMILDGGQVMLRTSARLEKEYADPTRLT